MKYLSCHIRGIRLLSNYLLTKEWIVWKETRGWMREWVCTKALGHLRHFWGNDGLSDCDTKVLWNEDAWSRGKQYLPRWMRHINLSM